MQDIEQINADITQEEMNFRETTKEYQRQMQVSKESFDNFKAQLEEVSSTIEANYLKNNSNKNLIVKGIWNEIMTPQQTDIKNC